MSLNTYPYNSFPPSSEQMGAGGGSYVLPAYSTTVEKIKTIICSYTKTTT